MDLKDLDGRRVKVANKFYTIKLKKSIRQDRLLGESNHDREVIKICTKQASGAFVDTLIHEILHCIWHTNGLGYTLDAEEVEEFIVHSYATSLMTVFIDNPWLIKLIDETVEKDYII